MQPTPKCDTHKLYSFLERPEPLRHFLPLAIICLIAGIAMVALGLYLLGVVAYMLLR